MFRRYPNPLSNRVAIFDGMTIVQKFKANGLTFHQVADHILIYSPDRE